jgi:hypothetical protein
VGVFCLRLVGCLLARLSLVCVVCVAYGDVGLRRWEEARQGWLVSCHQSDASSDGYPKSAIPLDVDEIIDLIFSQRWRAQEDDRAQFPHPVPLPQMVDILVDLWEAEGLDI